MMGSKVSDEASRSIKPLEGSRSRLRRTRSMEIQSIFASKALPEAGLGKNVIIDAHRCSGSRMHLRHPSAGRSVLQDHSSEPSQTLASYTRDSVRRRAASFLRPTRTQPDRGTVDY